MLFSQWPFMIYNSCLSVMEWKTADQWPDDACWCNNTTVWPLKLIMWVREEMVGFSFMLFSVSGLGAQPLLLTCDSDRTWCSATVANLWQYQDLNSWLSLPNSWCYNIQVLWSRLTNKKEKWSLPHAKIANLCNWRPHKQIVDPCLLLFAKNIYHNIVLWHETAIVFQCPLISCLP